MADEKEIMRDTSIFGVSKILAFFLAGLSGFIVARVLGPAAFGVFSALMLLMNYSQYLHFGLLTAMIKKVPYFAGRKQHRKVDKIKNVAFTGSLLVIAVVSLCLFIATFFLKDMSASTINSVRIVSVVMILQQVYFFYQNFFMVAKRFTTISKSMLVYSASYFVILLLLIFRFGLEGVFTTLLLSHILVISYFIKKGGLVFRLDLDVKNALKLAMIGFPFLMFFVLNIILMSVDRLLILKFLDNSQLGYYSVGFMILEVVILVPLVINYITLPHLLNRYGEKRDTKHLKSLLFQPLAILSYALAITIGFVFVLAPFAIFYLLPQYLASILVLKILLIATFFNSVGGAATNFLVTVNRERKILFLQLGAIVLMALLGYTAIQRGFGIIGVAVVAVATFFVYSTLIILYSLKDYDLGIVGTFVFFVKTYAPFVYMAVILLLLELVPLTGDLAHDALWIVIKMVILGVLILPLLWLVNRKTGVVRLFFEMLRSGVRKKKA
jgi:O-antigen/teichoic acid export membrane protein